MFAIQRQNISSFMEENIDNVVNVLQQKDLSIDEKASKIFPLLDSTFDYKLMSKLSLGQKVWLDISDKQRESFSKKFIAYMKNSYIDKLKLYTNEKASIKELKVMNPKRIWLITELSNDKNKYEIIYKFYPKGEDNWLIYDVNIIGVSLMRTYRAQFNDILKENSFDELLRKIDSTKK
jgi:phospholipid transport system substrate-binding protein